MSPEPSVPPEDPDLPLVRRAKAGDFSAFEALVERHERELFTLARHITGQVQDAEEVVQDTFVSAMEHLQSFRADARFRTWISRIATNFALKVLRKRRGLRSLDMSADEDQAPLPHPEVIAPWQSDPAVLAQRHEVQELLDAALARLDQKHRVVFVLRDVQGLSTEQTAEALGLSVPNTKVRLLRARLLLREQLTRKLGDPTRRVTPHRHE